MPSIVPVRSARGRYLSRATREEILAFLEIYRELPESEFPHIREQIRKELRNLTA